MKRLVPLLLPLIAAHPALAQTWSTAAQQQEEAGFSWTDPLWPSLWMAWTPATLALFVALFLAIGFIAVLEIVKYRDGIERKGVLGLTTTLGDRLFISLLGSAYIFLAWLGIFGQPLWWPLAISVVWGTFCFRKV